MQTQIERFRKGTSGILVRHQDGRPCAGAHVSVEQETHDFLFGCVVPDLHHLSPGDRERYQRRVREPFNFVQGDHHDSRVCADTRTVDLSKADQRIHLAKVQRCLDRLSEPAAQASTGLRGLHVYVSGRTVGLSAVERQSRPSIGNEREAAKRVAAFYTLCFSHPAVQAIFWKGVSDREPGVNGQGLLRDDLSPKHAHKTLLKLVRSIWHTRVRGQLDSLGWFRFRGFFGSYRVVIAAKDMTPAIAHLHLQAAHGEDAISVTLHR